MPTLVNGIVESESAADSTLSPTLSMPGNTKLESDATPYAHLIAEELQRTRAASDGDQRPTAAASAVRSVRAAKPKFRVVAVDENQVAPLLLRPVAPGSAFPAETPQLTVNGSPAAATTTNGVNDGSRRGGGVEAPGATDGGGSGDPGALGRHDSGVPLSTLRPAIVADNGGRRASLPPPPSVQRSPAAGEGYRSNGIGGAGSGGSPRPTSEGSSASAASAAATAAASGLQPAATVAADADSVTGVPDDQATVSSGVQHRIHYRKLREKTNSAAIDAEAGGSGTGGAVAAFTGSARMDRLAVPMTPSHYNSLPASGAGWSYPVLLTPVPATHRNISTLSLTLLLRDQRRKNLAMLARLFASRQKEKDMLDGQQQYQELVAEAKKKRRCRGVTAMHFVVGILFVTLVALVVTSINVFAPQRNIYSSQPGFVFDKDTRLLTVHNSSGYPLLQIRTGVDLRGLPYNCSSANDLASRRRCWKWNPSNVTLRVSVVNLSHELTCIGITWVTTSVEPVLRDCIVLGAMQWYGGASSRLLPWSLNTASASAGDAGFGPWLYAPGGMIGWLTARSWISSSGAMVAASGYTPLYVNVKGGSSPAAFCLSSWYGYDRGGARVLNYTACVAATVPTLHRRLVEAQRTAAVWTDGDIVDTEPPSDDVGRSKVADTATTSTSTTAVSSPTTSLPADIARDSSVLSVDENDAAGHRGPAFPDAVVPTSSTGDEAKTDGSSRSSAIARSRTRWASSVVMRDPVWLVRAGLNASAAVALLNRIVTHGFAVGTFLVRDGVLSEANAVATAVANVIAAARELNSTVPAFGLTVSAFVSMRSELFLDAGHQGLWTRTARSALPVLVRDPAVDAGSVSVASLLVNSSSDVALELAEQGVNDVIIGARVASSNSSIALLYLRVAVAIADLDLDSYSPATQERLLASPHWFARLGDDLSRSVAASMSLESAASPGESENVGHLDGRPAVSSSPPLVLVDGTTTGLAGYALPESVRRGSLADIVTHMVAASVAGDPPASIGPFAPLDATISGSTDADAKRRYVLWLQLAAFAPVLQLDVAPWEYGDDVAEQARRIFAYRDAEIVPRLRRLYEAFRLTGEPVYKPLWWNDSIAAAAKASKLGTEFYLEDLLVAPVLDQRPYRLIYFPTGYWLDQGQKLFIGPGTHNVTIDPNVLPCFLRKTTGIHETGIPEGEVGSRRRR